MESAPIAIKFKQVMKEDKNTKCVSQFYYLLFIKSSNLMTTYCMSLHLKFFFFFTAHNISQLQLKNSSEENMRGKVGHVLSEEEVPESFILKIIIRYSIQNPKKSHFYLKIK